MNEFAGPPGSLCAFTYHLVHAAQDVETRVEHALEEGGLSLAKMKLLRHLNSAKEAIPLGALAEKNSCVKSNVTQLMDRMEGEGLVRRIPDPDDRLALAETEVMASFSAAERQQLIEFLERLRSAVPA